MRKEQNTRNDALRINIAEKKKVLDEYCKHQNCRKCLLISTEYCQLGDKSIKAINSAFDVYVNAGL